MRMTELAVFSAIVISRSRSHIVLVIRSQSMAGFANTVCGVVVYRVVISELSGTVLAIVEVNSFSGTIGLNWHIRH